MDRVPSEAILLRIVVVVRLFFSFLFSIHDKQKRSSDKTNEMKKEKVGGGGGKGVRVVRIAN